MKIEFEYQETLLTQTHVRSPDIVPREGVETVFLLGTQRAMGGSLPWQWQGRARRAPARSLGLAWGGCVPRQDGPASRACSHCSCFREGGWGGKPPSPRNWEKGPAASLVSRCQTPESNRAACAFCSYEIAPVCLLGQLPVFP